MSVYRRPVSVQEVDPSVTLPVSVPTGESLDVSVPVGETLPISVPPGDTIPVDFPSDANLGVSLAASLRDAFGRLRISEPRTLFDSKQLHTNQSIYFDDQEVSGSSTSSVYDSDRASTTISVANLFGGKRVRQTYMRFNYQPGKSQLILCTGILRKSGGGNAIVGAFGFFDDNNGVFVEDRTGTVGFVLRSSVTGTPVDNRVPLASCNVDPFDGTGPSGVTFDPTKVQIFFCDFEWLGVGSVRVGFVIDGQFYTGHIFQHANLIDSVYMSTPNLPIRYEIENLTGGGPSSLEHICSTVISEGGQEPSGQLATAFTGNAALDFGVGNLGAMIGIRLKSDRLDQVVEMVTTSLVDTAGKTFEWGLYWNPTVAGTFTYSSFSAESAIEVAIGTNANTVTGGTCFQGGLVSGSKDGISLSSDLLNAIRLGSAIDGTPDTFVLCARPYETGGALSASLTWRETF